MMEKMMRQMGKGKMPSLPGLDLSGGLPGGGLPGGPPAVAPLQRRSAAEETEEQQAASGRR